MLGAEILESNILQPGGIGQLHRFYFNGLSRDSNRAVFVLRPDRDLGAKPDQRTWCLDHNETIERLKLERHRQIYIYPFLGFEIRIGDMVNEYTPPDLSIQERFKSLSFSWSEVFTRLLGEEKLAMAFFSRLSRRLSHLDCGSLLKEDMSNVEGLMGRAGQQPMFWDKTQLARPWPDLTPISEQRMLPICRQVARLGRPHYKPQYKLNDIPGLEHLDPFRDRHWYRSSLDEITKDYPATGSYDKNFSEIWWYRSSMQWTTQSLSHWPGSTSSAHRSGLSATSESEKDPRIAFPSHGSRGLSSRHAVQERSQYMHQSEALEPSSADSDRAPDPRPLTRPVTPTEPSSRENQTLPNAPKKSKGYAHKFSEADIQDYNPQGLIEAGMERMEIASPLASDDEDMSQGSIVVGLERSEPTPFLIWEDGDMSQGSIEAGIERMEIDPSLVSENKDVSQSTIEAGIGSVDSTPSLDSEDEDMFDEAEFWSQWVEATVVAEG